MKMFIYFFILVLFFPIVLISCDSYDKNIDGYVYYRIIAHRGYWDTENSAQNSIKSLLAADDVGTDCCSLDLCITADDSVVVAHGPKHGGMVIADNSFAKLREKRLSNGEYLPTLNEYLRAADSIHTPLTLFIEIKQKGSEKRIVDMVAAHNLSSQVVYTSYNLSSCKKVLEYDSAAIVGNHRGRLSPAELKEYGIRCMCYDIDILKENQCWIEEAHQLGMYVVAGAKRRTELRWLSSHGVDYIGTDDPVKAIEFREANCRPR